MPLKYSVPSFRKGEQSQDGVLGHGVLCLGWTQTFESFTLILWLGSITTSPHGRVQRAGGLPLRKGAAQGLGLQWTGVGFVGILAEVAVTPSSSSAKVTEASL